MIFFPVCCQGVFQPLEYLLSLISLANSPRLLAIKPEQYNFKEIYIVNCIVPTPHFKAENAGVQYGDKKYLVICDISGCARTRTQVS